MRKNTILTAALVALAALAPLAAANASTWTVDAAHTEVNFSVNHFFTPVSGSFDDFEVTLDYDAEHPEKSTISPAVGRWAT